MSGSRSPLSCSHNIKWLLNPTSPIPIVTSRDALMYDRESCRGLWTRLQALPVLFEQRIIPSDTIAPPDEGARNHKRYSDYAV